MVIERKSILISESIGAVSSEWCIPDNPQFIMTLAHGAGAGMDHNFMVKLSQALSNRGIATVRFNFPYMEKRIRRPDSPAIAHLTIKKVIERVMSYNTKVPLIVSGKSFGGRMTSQLIAKEEIPSVKAIIFYGFPLHPDKKPSMDRAEHLHLIKLPMLFLQGEKDGLADLKLIQALNNMLPTSTLITFAKADHSFKVGKSEIIDELAKKSLEYLQSLQLR